MFASTEPDGIPTYILATQSLHNTALRDGLQSLWRNGELLDYTLCMGDQKYPVHKAVVASASQYFYDALTQGDKKEDNHAIHNELPSEIIENMVQFLYTNKLTLSEKNVNEIHQVASLYQIPALLKLCSQHETKKSDSKLAEDALATALRGMWEKKEFCDYTICVANSEFSVHRVVIAAFSCYFRAMLIHGMTESRQDSVKIMEVSSESTQALIEYMYTGKIALTVENAPEILAGAVYLQIDAAIVVCTHFMIAKLDLDTWMDTIQVFKSFGLKDAVEDVHKFIVSILMDIPYHCNHSRVMYEDLCFLIENWQETEFHLCKFILNWVNGNASDRKDKLDELLCCVRYGLMTAKNIQHIKTKKYYLDDPSQSWCKLVDSAEEYLKLPLHKRVRHKSEQTKVRSEPRFVMFGEGKPGGILENFENGFIKNEGLEGPKGYDVTYLHVVVNNFVMIRLIESRNRGEVWYLLDPRSCEWELMPELPPEYHAPVIASDDDFVYIAGTESRDHDVFDKVDRFDFATKQWSTISRLPVKLREHRAVVFQNGLYVLGGFPEDFDPEYESYDEKLCAEKGLKTVHRMDLTTQKWEKRAPMFNIHYEEERFHVMKVDGEEVLCILDTDWSCEFYVPSTDQWFTTKYEFDQEPPALFRALLTGNQVFIMGADLSDAKSGLVEVTLPEKGRKASLEVKWEFKSGFLGFLVKFYVLSICPYTPNV